MQVISIDIMLERFINYINSKRLFSPLDTLVVAVSGGVDSVVLVNLFRQTNFRFVIAHMNFNLREKDSERDELFVRNLAGEAGVPVFVKNVNTIEYATTNKLSIQETARVLRYEWFELLRQEQVKESLVASDGGSALIVTAHHLDDSVETMMMNFFRGTGITGLRGILPVQGKIVRPLLCFTKDEIVSYAKSRELNWVEDVSNQQDKYTRNYFRNNVIPMIRKTYPQVNQNLYNNLARFNDAFILYRETVDKNIKKLVVVVGSELHIPVLKLKKMPAKETILFEIIQNYGFTASQVPQVISLMDGETGKQVLSEKFRVIKNRNWLIIAPVQQEDTGYVVIEPEDDMVSFEKGTLKIRRQFKNTIRFRSDRPDIPEQSSPAIAMLDAKKIQFPLLLRRWKNGDYFYPLGMKKKKKIGRFLIDTKLSKTEKESLWVIESDKKIIWLVGIRIDDRFKITESTTEVISVTGN